MPCEVRIYAHAYFFFAATVRIEPKLHSEREIDKRMICQKIHFLRRTAGHWAVARGSAKVLTSPSCPLLDGRWVSPPASRNHEVTRYLNLLVTQRFKLCIMRVDWLPSREEAHKCLPVRTRADGAA